MYIPVLRGLSDYTASQRFVIRSCLFCAIAQSTWQIKDMLCAYRSGKTLEIATLARYTWYTKTRAYQ